MPTRMNSTGEGLDSPHFQKIGFLVEWFSEGFGSSQENLAGCDDQHSLHFFILDLGFSTSLVASITMFRSFGKRVLPLLYDMRTPRESRRELIPGALALATVGAGAVYLSGFCNGETEILLSLSPPLHEYVSQSWQTLQKFPRSIPWNHFSSSGYIPLQFSIPGSVSADFLTSTGTRKDEVRISIKNLMDTSGTVSSGGGCSNGCLGRDSIAKAAAKVGPAVVNISVIRGFYGMSIGSIGSGTIIDPDGTILTCAHVVVDSQSRGVLAKGKVEVTLQDGRKFEGVILNADVHSDIAVVKIKSNSPLPAAKLGLSANLHPGEWVLAVGCPLSLQNTVTAGIVSCVDRKSSDLGLSGSKREYLQTDCAINEGNSGGPLVNLDGEVVGVNIMKIQYADGVSFAVPMDSVSAIIEQFKKHGRVVRPWIGLKMIDLNHMVVAQLKEKNPSFPSVTKGILVPMVTPGGPAERAGFRPGDVVIELEGKTVSTIKEFVEIMGDKVGKQLKVLVKRENDVIVPLSVVPEEANPAI